MTSHLPAGPTAERPPPPSTTSDWIPTSTLPPEPFLASRLPDAATIALLRQLQRQQGPQALRALVLALMQTPGSAREAQAWREETLGLHHAEHLPLLLQELTEEGRLPLLEWALHQCAAAEAADRSELLRSARRVMSADGRCARSTGCAGC